jgi:hypothetical protein
MSRPVLTQVGSGGVQPPGWLPAPGLGPQSSRCVDAFIEEGDPARKRIRTGKNRRRPRMRRTPSSGKAGATTALLRHTTMDLWLGGAKVARELEGACPTCREPSRLLPTRQVVALGWPHPSPEGVPSREGLSQGRAHRPCHQRAIHSGCGRCPADGQGQRQSGLGLRCSPPLQGHDTAELALGADDRSGPRRSRNLRSCVAPRPPGGSRRSVTPSSALP